MSQRSNFSVYQALGNVPQDRQKSPDNSKCWTCLTKILTLISEHPTTYFKVNVIEKTNQLKRVFNLLGKVSYNIFWRCCFLSKLCDSKSWTSNCTRLKPGVELTCRASCRAKINIWNWSLKSPSLFNKKYRKPSVKYLWQKLFKSTYTFIFFWPPSF